MEAIGLLEVARLHSPHAHVAQDRQQPQRIQGAAASHRPQLWPGADRELDHAYFEQLRDQEMPTFVGCDQDQEHPADADRNQEPVERFAHAFSLPELTFTYSLAQRSASRISCSESRPPGKAVKALSTLRTMPLKGMSPARNAFTASSLAAFRTAGWPPPAPAALRASLTLGNLCSSRAWNSSPLSSSSAVGERAPASRSG